jgi:hypothetical protein
MLVRLSRAKRLRAGWLLALAYLLCVLAPGVAFALGDGRLAAHCLFEDLPIGLAIQEQETSHAGVHQHLAQAAHEHLGHHDHAAHHAQAIDLVGAKTSQSLPAPGDHHATPGVQCCGMLCVSALPVVIAEMLTPHPLVTFCPAETSRNVADNPPPQHYRPPIS